MDRCIVLALADHSDAGSGCSTPKAKRTSLSQSHDSQNNTGERKMCWLNATLASAVLSGFLTIVPPVCQERSLRDITYEHEGVEMADMCMLRSMD
jgi:hypothetical protein